MKEKTWHFDSTWLSLVSLFSHTGLQQGKEKNRKTPSRLGLVFFDGVLESSVCLELLSTRRELVRMRMNKRGGWNENRDNIYRERERERGRALLDVYTQQTCERNRRIHATHVYYIIPLNYWFRSFQPGPRRTDGRPTILRDRERERWQKGRHVHTTLSPRWNVCVYRGRKTKKWRNERYIRENEGENTWLVVVRALRTLLTFFLYSSFSFFFFPRHSTSGWLAIPDAIKKKKSKAYIAAFSSSSTLPPTSGGLDEKIHHAVTISRIRTRTPDGRRTRAHTYYI